MASKITQNDKEILTAIGEHQALTVKQLSVLSQRSFQVIRRRKRTMEREGLIATKMQGYGHGRGRPEEFVFLTEKGTTFLEGEGIQSCNFLGKVEDRFFSDHHLLVNWFRIHLLQTERTIPQLSVNYLDPNFHPEVLPTRDRPSLLERVLGKKRPEKPPEFIPDGVFSITDKETEKKTLLFFLEVDMGTETLVSVDRNPKDIRQKILRYQDLFRSGRYKKYERVFDSKFNGFRLLFLANSAARLISLCRLVQGMPPSDFVWLVDQGKMFSHGVSAEIWVRGGRDGDPPQSILGHRFACELPVVCTDTN
jgi:hypothetical protein